MVALCSWRAAGVQLVAAVEEGREAAEQLLFGGEIAAAAAGCCWRLCWWSRRQQLVVVAAGRERLIEASYWRHSKGKGRRKREKRRTGGVTA